MSSPTKFCNLTKPQWELLAGIVDGSTRTCSDTYKPFVSLQASRLIRVAYAGWANYLEATDAGKRLVADVRQKMEAAK